VGGGNILKYHTGNVTMGINIASAMLGTAGAAIATRLKLNRHFSIVLDYPDEA